MYCNRSLLRLHLSTLESLVLFFNRNVGWTRGIALRAEVGTNVSMDNCLFQNNTPYDMGTVFNRGSMMVTNSMFQNNNGTVRTLDVLFVILSFNHIHDIVRFPMEREELSLALAAQTQPLGIIPFSQTITGSPYCFKVGSLPDV
jgi:hypothetical protein